MKTQNYEQLLLGLSGIKLPINNVIQLFHKQPQTYEKKKWQLGNTQDSENGCHKNKSNSAA